MQRAALLFVVMASACVSVGKSVLDTSFQARPVAEEDVFVYVTGDSVPEHTRVAMLDAKGNTDWTDEGDLLNKLRQEAGKLGANAIIWGETEDAGTGARVAQALLGTSANRTTTAIAIYVPSLARGGNDNR